MRILFIYNKYFLMSLYLLGTGICKAQTSATRLDSLFTTLYTHHEFNGNITVVEKSRIVYQKSFGYADVENKTYNAGNTAFNLASVSKTFTALAILQLKQGHKLGLDDSFSKYFPEFPWPQVTIRHLLSHTSGLPDYQIFELPYQKNPDSIYTIDNLIPAMKADKRGLLFKSGENFSYSNTGYGLLALLVEKLGRMPFQDYLSKYIFKPAGMHNTYVHTPLLPIKDPSRAKRYEFLSYDKGELKSIDSVPRDRIDAVVLGAILGPTAVVSTTMDMMKYDEALYSGKLVKTELLDEAFKPAVSNDGKRIEIGWGNTKSYYGLGWMILKDSTYGKIVWHSGGAAGVVTAFIRNLSRKQTLVVLDNVTHRGLHAEAIRALYLLNGGKSKSDKSSLADIYIATLHMQGADAAIAKYYELVSDTIGYYMDERELNRMAFDLLGDGFQLEALEAFKFNTLINPTSFNTYDSYGFALSKAGKKKEAITMYTKSLAINPENEEGKKALEELLK